MSPHEWGGEIVAAGQTTGVANGHFSSLEHVRGLTRQPELFSVVLNGSLMVVRCKRLGVLVLAACLAAGLAHAWAAAPLDSGHGPGQHSCPVCFAGIWAMLTPLPQPSPAQDALPIEIRVPPLPAANPSLGVRGPRAPPAN